MAKAAWQNAEAEFESVWAGKKDRWCYAFEDSREAIGLSQSRRVFTKGRPSDYLVTVAGTTFFAEVKSSQSKTSFNLNNVEDAQWIAARRATASGCLYFFFIRSEELGKWFQVPGGILVAQLFIKKSITWAELEPYYWKEAIK